MSETNVAMRSAGRHFDTRHMRGQEVETQRNESSKTFALGRGLYQTVIYPDRVHYRDHKGDWCEIDSRLKPAARGEQALETIAGPLHTRLAMRADANPLISMRDEQGHMLRWRLEGASGVPCTQKNLRKLDDNEDENRALVDKSTATALYVGVLPDTDLVCELHGDRLKESLVLNSPDAPLQYSFTLDMQGLAWEETEGGGLRLWEDTNPNEDVFRLPPPYMIDAAGAQGDVLVDWQALDGALRMTLTPDVAFLSEAQYPVVIDPTVQSAQTAAVIQDTFLSESKATSAYGGAVTMRVGKHDTYGQCRALVKIVTLPEIDKAYTIAKAWMGLEVLPTSSMTTDAYLYAHRVQETWNESDAKWNNQPAYDEKHLDYVLVKKGETSVKAIQLDITNPVRDWYADPNSNFGVMLDSHENQTFELCASENTTYAVARRPIIYVNYVSKAGLESYLTYESFGAGRAGTAHVALHSGNLAVTRGLTAMSGNRMPVSLGLTWNACTMDKNYYGVGKGWQLNWSQSLRREQPATGDYYYVLTDGDGTEHEFHKHEKTTEEQSEPGFIDYYEDRSGLSLKLYEGATEAEIVSKDHSKLVFPKPTVNYATPPSNTKVKMVSRAQDALGNTATFEHDTSLRLTKVTDGVGRITTLAYEPSNEVHINVPGYTSQVVLALDTDGHLISITDLDDNGSQYIYGPEPGITNAKAVDNLRLLRNTVDGACIASEFDQRYRVTQIRAYVSNSTDYGDGTQPIVTAKGNERSYTYFDCVTQVRDLTVANGKMLTYQFNDYGNVVAVHDELGFAAFAKFGMGKPNTPEAVSKLQRLAMNLLDMRDFSEDSGWKSGVIGTDDIARESTVTLSGLKPLCLECPAPKWLSQGETAYAEHLVACDAGDYTFSVSVQSKGDVLAWAELDWMDEKGTRKNVSSEKVRRVGSSQQLTCRMTLLQSTMVCCRVLANDGTGAAWFDRAQLERGTLASHYNMLQNSNFTAMRTGEWPEGWLFADGNEATDDEARAAICVAAESLNKPVNLGANCLRLQSAFNQKTAVYQELDIRGKKDDNYVMGGWARAWAAPSGDKRTFRLRVQFQKKNAVWVDGGTADWNEEWVDWQYACGAAVAPADYRKMRVFIDYDENLNEAQIGVVSLTKEYYGQNFAYDGKNNITAVSTLLGQKDKAEYDKFDNLTSYVQPGRDEGDKYTFFYGTTDAEKKRHLPLWSETPLGLVTETRYDAHGNATESIARSKSDGTFIRTGTTYTANGNYALGTTDALGNTTWVEIDSDKGRTISATDAAGQMVTYEYDDPTNRIISTKADVGEGAGAMTYANTYHYVNDRLTTVKHNTTNDPLDDVTYTFETDALGNQTTVKVGNRILSTNVYTDSGDKLLTAVEYGNHGKVSYTYDSFKRINSITYDGADVPRFTYEYGANGAVGCVKDTILVREARMTYDLVDRPVEAELYEDGALKYRLTQEYDRFEQPSVLHERVEEPDNTRSEHTISVTYDKESKPTAVTCESAHMTAVGVPDGATKRKLAYRYDGLGRVLRRDFHANGGANQETDEPLFQTVYGYAPGGYGENSATMRVRSIDQAGRRYEYEYDKLGNITRESWQGMAAAGGDIGFENDAVASPDGDTLTLDAATLESRYQTTYLYDALGQLLRVNDKHAGTTWTYEYDLGGNLLTKIRYAYTTAADLSALTPAQTVSYTYGDADWKDMLTVYDGHAITYRTSETMPDDTIGNPLTYNGWTYTWKAGRMLQSMTNSNTTAQFVYDHTGLRVKKSVNGVDTLYTLNGKKITHIRKGTDKATGTDAVRMHFFYDAQGRPMLVRYMDIDYAYLHNLQGDVVGIVDMDGVSVVEYRYDAWGMPTSTNGSMAETLGRDNPFRYRGYVWDEETGLYYLRSRYYNPEWGRFVNADNVLGNSSGLLNHNLVSYCGNNPITRSDTDGQKYTTPIAPGQNLLDIINEQTITFASADELLEEQLRIINNDVRYKTGGRSDKIGYDCATFISQPLDDISGGKIKCETGTGSMLRNRRNSFLFIADLSDYDLDEIPIGAIFIRDKGDFTEEGLRNGHAATYAGVTPDGPMTYMAVGLNNGIKAVPYNGQFTYVAWPRGLRASKVNAKRASHIRRIAPRRGAASRGLMRIVPY